MKVSWPHTDEYAALKDFAEFHTPAVSRKFWKGVGWAALFSLPFWMVFAVLGLREVRMKHSGFCDWCGKKVERFSSRGNPFKYCTPECDKQAMAKRVREWRRGKTPSPNKSWFERVKVWFTA